ncbi:unnamed protein product [Calicophoron daubneyi]|uniref:Cytochrome c oxidase subunit 5B, mitochondrial n=1 Tax=Calicophoron daubneyi TaxID=300641 RepID=A0AAV2TNF6_CALDB
MRTMQAACRYLIRRGVTASLRVCRYESEVAKNEPSFPILAEAVKAKDYRLICELITNQDPYEVRRVNMSPTSSRESPNLVASDAVTRMIGCVCEPEADAINWMELAKGKPVQCYCGHWFELVSYGEYFKRTSY